MRTGHRGNESLGRELACAGMEVAARVAANHFVPRALDRWPLPPQPEVAPETSPRRLNIGCLVASVTLASGMVGGYYGTAKLMTNAHQNTQAAYAQVIEAFDACVSGGKSESDCGVEVFHLDAALLSRQEELDQCRASGRNWSCGWGLRYEPPTVDQYYAYLTGKAHEDPDRVEWVIVGGLGSGLGGFVTGVAALITAEYVPRRPAQ